MKRARIFAQELCGDAHGAAAAPGRARPQAPPLFTCARDEWRRASFKSRRQAFRAFFFLLTRPVIPLPKVPKRSPWCWSASCAGPGTPPQEHLALVAGSSVAPPVWIEELALPQCHREPLTVAPVLAAAWPCPQSFINTMLGARTLLQRAVAPAARSAARPQVCGPPLGTYARLSGAGGSL